MAKRTDLRLNGESFDDDSPTEKLQIYEYWTGMDPGDVPAFAAEVLDDKVDDWREMTIGDDDLWVYVVDDMSWVTDEAPHDVRLDL